MSAEGKKTAIKEAKTLVKMRQHYTCEKCGKPGNHGAHIMPVTYAGTCADPDNLLCLCSSCHSVGPKSAHQNPHDFVRWFEERWPGRYDVLREKANEYTRHPVQIDWKELTKELRELQKDAD
jgi:hypothetical protein